MGVYRDIKLLPDFKNSVITIGTFDGVHLGHQKILHTVKEYAEKYKGESIVITFDPHPRELLFPEKPLQTITPLEKKINLIRSYGIDHVVVVPFTASFAALSAVDYIRSFLVEKFHPKAIVIGYDHHFGQDREGNIQLLKKEQENHGYELVEISEQLVDESKVSSTQIRRAIQAGDMQACYAMTGRYYQLSGKVVEGKQLGRTIGFPTANILPLYIRQLIPGTGVYAVKVLISEKEYGGMLSIGYNPTVTDDTSLKIEVHIFDFNEDIYSEIVEVVFIQKTREEEKFENIELLQEQLKKDEIQIRAMLNQS